MCYITFFQHLRGNQLYSKTNKQTNKQTNKEANKHLIVGMGDNLQLFISPLLKKEEWLYNIIDDKIFEINSLEPPVQGVWKLHVTT